MKNKAIEFLTQHKWLLLILLLGSFLRLFHLDYQSLWLDEIHTLNEADPNTPIADLYDKILASEQMPPLYYYLIYFLFKIFGYHVIVMRMFSALVGIVSIYAMYLLGKEIYHKKTGLFASFLLAVNYFHIYHSQDARPYGLLVLCSILSLYYFIKLIKQNNLKQALIFGLFLGLTISTHFFGFFLAFSLGVLALFFLVYPSFKLDLKLLKHFVVSFLVGIIIFIPSIKALQKALQIKEFWIPMPEKNAFEIIFSRYFNDSEFMLYFASIFGIIYLIALVKQKNVDTKELLLKNPVVLSFIIVSLSICSIIIVPLIRSYTSVPMILDRYFIVLIPLVFIMYSVGLVVIKNTIVKNTLLILFLLFSITDLFIVSKYYFKPNKAQFREVTEFINKNNLDNDPILSELNWYLPYFIKDKKITYIDGNLDNYIAKVKQDSTLIRPFWYFGGHSLQYSESSEIKEFLDQNFYLKNNYDGFQAWAKHFGLKKDRPKTINLEGLKSTNDNYKFEFHIEFFEVTKQQIIVKGWAFLDGIDSSESNTTIIAVFDKNLSDGKILNKEIIVRPDLTSVKGKNNNYDLSGFEANLEIDDTINYENLTIFIVIETKDGLIKKIMTTDKNYSKNI